MMRSIRRWFGYYPSKVSREERVRPYTLRRQTSPADYLRPQRWNWDLLLRPLDERLSKRAEQELPKSIVVGLRFFWLDGLFATISDNFYVTFLPLFALTFNASNGTIGLLTAITNLFGTIALFPGAKMVEIVGRRKPVVVWAGGIFGRLSLIFLVILPFVTESYLVAIGVIIGVSAIRAFMGNFANPGWTSLTADLVPPSMRGRYFASRNRVMGIAALVVAPIAGWLIRRGDGLFSLPHFGYQIIFFLALLFGMVSTFFFANIPEPEHSGGKILRHQRGDLRKALRRAPTFIWFVASAFIWNLAIQVAAPFFNVYLITGLHGTTSLVGLSAGITSLFALFGQSLFGRLIDRKGNFWVQRLTGLLIPVLPALWILVATPWQAVLISVVGGFVWAGFNLSNFNLLLDLTPTEQRARAVALYQTVVFAAAVIGPLAGGYLTDLAGFKLIFAVSFVGRLVGMLIFLVRVRSPGPKSDR